MCKKLKRDGEKGRGGVLPFMSYLTKRKKGNEGKSLTKFQTDLIIVFLGFV